MQAQHSDAMIRLRRNGEIRAIWEVGVGEDQVSAVCAKVAEAVQALRDIAALDPRRSQAVEAAVAEIHRRFPMPLDRVIEIRRGRRG